MNSIRLSYERKVVLEEIRNMTAKELLKKYHMVIYSQEDIAKINRGLVLIQEVLSRNNNLLEKCDKISLLTDAPNYKRRKHEKTSKRTNSQD